MTERHIADDEARVFRKVSRRLVGFLFVLFFLNYVDRTNIGFAALTMNRELGMSASFFGIVLAAFSVAYLVCEIPSNLALERFGARIWIARIMVTWGLAAAACAFAVGPKSLLGLRVLVGIAEAGFVPGMILYLTYWFPQYQRAKAQSKFLIAQPIAVAVGSILSGLIMELDGAFGISGWRWLLFLEGLPAVALGVAVYFYLDDRPADAKWLTAGERQLIQDVVRRDAEEREAVSETQEPVWRLLFARNMLLISFAYLTLVSNFGASGYWLPQIVRGVAGPTVPFWIIGLLSAIPAIGSALAMPYLSRSSDEKKERFWHTIIPMVLAALAWIEAAVTTQPLLQMVGLTMAAVTSGGIWSLFFAMPSAILPRRAHAVGIAFMNTIGIGGTALAPIAIGYLRDLTGGFAVPLLFIGGLLLAGAATMLCVPQYLLRGDGSDKRTLEKPVAAL